MNLKAIKEYVEMHELGSGDEWRERTWKIFTTEEREETQRRLREAMHERNAAHAVSILENLPADVRERVLTQFRREGSA